MWARHNKNIRPRICARNTAGTHHGVCRNLCGGQELQLDQRRWGEALRDLLPSTQRSVLLSHVRSTIIIQDTRNNVTLSIMSRISTPLVKTALCIRRGRQVSGDFPRSAANSLEIAEPHLFSLQLCSGNRPQKASRTLILSYGALSLPRHRAL